MTMRSRAITWIVVTTITACQTTEHSTHSERDRSSSKDSLSLKISDDQSIRVQCGKDNSVLLVGLILHSSFEWDLSECEIETTTRLLVTEVVDGPNQGDSGIRIRLYGTDSDIRPYRLAFRNRLLDAADEGDFEFHLTDDIQTLAKQIQPLVNRWGIAFQAERTQVFIQQEHELAHFDAPAEEISQRLKYISMNKLEKLADIFRLPSEADQEFD